MNTRRKILVTLSKAMTERRVWERSGGIFVVIVG